MIDEKTEQEIIQSYTELNSVNAIQKKFGLSRDCVKRVVKKYGLTLRGRNKQKATTEELAASYARTMSVWETAKEFGMCGQTVHMRLFKAGLTNPINVLKEDEEKLIREVYESGMERGDGKLDMLAKRLNRRKSSICKYARAMGLTSMRRTYSDEFAKRNKTSRQGFWSIRTHPRGMLGKHHTYDVKLKLHETSKKMWSEKTEDERIETVKKQLEGKIAKYGSLARNVRKGSWFAGYRKIGGKKIFFRSRWEANYCRYLEFLKQRGRIKDWKHEPYTILFENENSSYLPDFEVERNNGTKEIHEVKGWFDDRSEHKIELMLTQHKELKLKIIFGKMYRLIELKFGQKIDGWEFVQKPKKTTLLKARTSKIVIKDSKLTQQEFDLK